MSALAVIKSLAAHDLIPQLVRELPAYVSLAASSQAFNRADIKEYTTNLLRWWSDNYRTIPTWGKAARMVFALTCTSAACERVFYAKIAGILLYWAAQASYSHRSGGTRRATTQEPP